MIAGDWTLPPSQFLPFQHAGGKLTIAGSTAPQLVALLGQQALSLPGGRDRHPMSSAWVGWVLLMAGLWREDEVTGTSPSTKQKGWGDPRAPRLKIRSAGFDMGPKTFAPCRQTAQTHTILHCIKAACEENTGRQKTPLLLLLPSASPAPSTAEPISSDGTSDRKQGRVVRAPQHPLNISAHPSGGGAGWGGQCHPPDFHVPTCFPPTGRRALPCFLAVCPQATTGCRLESHAPTLVVSYQNRLCGGGGRQQTHWFLHAQ